MLGIRLAKVSCEESGMKFVKYEILVNVTQFCRCGTKSAQAASDKQMNALGKFQQNFMCDNDI